MSQPPVIVVADLTSRNWMGGGLFWPLAKHLYQPLDFGLYLAKAAAVREAAYNFSAQTFYSLERLGYVAESLQADWALVHPRSAGLQRLAKMYDLVLAAPQLVRHCMVRLSRQRCQLTGARGRVVTLLDEPFKFGGQDPIQAVNEANASGACSTCVLAHFQHAAAEYVRPLRPPYDASLFAPYMRNPHRRGRRFMLARRCYWPGELSVAMSSFGLRYPIREAWTEKAPMDQHSYLRKLASCRWVLDIEFKPSAGQIVVEAALLGVPSFAGHGRTNAELLLPPDLLLPRNATLSSVIARINSTVHYYERRPDEYVQLCTELKDRAARLFRPPSARELYRTASECC